MSSQNNNKNSIQKSLLLALELQYNGVKSCVQKLIGESEMDENLKIFLDSQRDIIDALKNTVCCVENQECPCDESQKCEGEECASETSE